MGMLKYGSFSTYKFIAPQVEPKITPLSLYGERSAKT